MNRSRLINNRVSQGGVEAVNGFQSRLSNWVGLFDFWNVSGICWNVIRFFKYFYTKKIYEKKIIDEIRGFMYEVMAIENS